MRVGIIPNISKDNDLKITGEILNWFADKEAVVLLEKQVAEKLGCNCYGYDIASIYSSSDIIIVLGGDGTILNISRQSSKYNVPIFGINLGHLGFLAEAEAGEMYAALEKILQGDYFIEKRMMLEASIEENNTQVENFVALNDIGITRGPFSRIITYSIYINGSFVDLYSADGIVISSPTGSTAYSLSAGGPIVSPDLNVIIVTPVCPHTLHSRSIVVSDKDEVKVEICNNNTEVMLTVDGQLGYKLKSGETVTIRSSACATNLVKLKQRSFFDVLRRKMSEERDYKNI
ncbi:MAG: NAD(+)/NADH kinase [Caulobacteraceae bacterium]